MPAQLLALNDGPGILVDKPILLLGRHPECDIQIDSRKISRRHCCIAQVQDYLVVRDLDSTNGILINGIRVMEGKLLDGDELTIGSHRYQVSWDDAPNPLPAGKGKHPPTVPQFDDDEMLESCEEPVALPDPGRSPYRPPPAPVGSLPLQGTDEAAPVVLPENLQLMPNSGSYPGPSRPHS